MLCDRYSQTYRMHSLMDVFHAGQAWRVLLERPLAAAEARRTDVLRIHGHKLALRR